MFKVPSRVKVSTAPRPARPDRSILTAAKGGGIVFAGNLFEYGCRFIMGIVLARLLGAKQLGLCNLSMSAASIAAGLALLGLPSAMVRYVSLFLNRRDTAGLWGTLQVGLGLTTIVSVAMGIGLFVLADPIAEQWFHESRLAPLLRLMSLAVPFLALSSIIGAATRGFKKMQYAVISQHIAQPTIRLILVVALTIAVGLNAKRALVAYSLVVMIAFVMLLYFLNSLFPLKRPLRTARRDARGMLGYSLPVYLTNLISIFGGNIKTMLLGSLSTVTSVGIFVVASQVNIIGKTFHAGINTASAPIVSELHDRGEWEQLGRFYQTVTKWTFTLNLPLFLIVLLFPVPILSIFGKSFVGGATALTILAWANLVRAGTGIGGTVIQMTGNTSLRLVNSLVTFALNVGLNILLIPRWGLIGAATASLAGSVTNNLLYFLEVFILFRLLPYNPSFAKPVAAGLIVLVAAWGMRQLFPIQTNLFYLAMNLILLLAVYAGMILLLGLSQEDRAVLARVAQRVRAMLSK